ncbi:Signal transduction histidine kinase [Peptoclostridium litorale DSM 5388]|uniref:histidine kinase n=1 Tax=Peptoclostridium litorale DSM 5388 TaxID=1121324 RepID=A0A069RI18_PEPLI|nr:HAMP domain-containing sensor histidine kinase [Peptoclostridium litorale]KDR96664.1 sensor histidine kinase ResE [Peptoclostridium litorale DSM 5388]SIN67940.1 Signal transduction histidine kinase [Peptoclostridium litorale DSM 5388]
MTIKKRLQMSYIAMTLISMTLMIFLNYFVNIRVFNSIGEGNTSTNPYSMLSNIFAVQESITRRINIADLEFANDPDSQEAVEFLKSFESDLAEIHSGVLIRNSDDIVYSSDIIKDSIGKIYLPKFKEPFEENHFFVSDKQYMLISQHDFYLDDGSEYSMFVVLDTKLLHAAMGHMRTKFSLIISFAILFTSGIITYFMHKSIALPLQRLKMASQEIKNGNLNFSIDPFSDDEIGELGIAFEDMRKRLKDMLHLHMKYEKDRQNIIANISHDLKTPIMSIKGHIEGIRDGIANSPEKLEKYMDIIYKKASEMEVMIGEVFTCSRLDLGKVSFNFKDIDICDYIDFCVEDLSLAVEKRNGTLGFEKPAASPVVIADPEKLRRVFTNIITNALKYMDKGIPKIWITLDECHEMVKIGIHDNGMGIPEESLPFIFDRFYRADESRNTIVPGSGIGLAISKQIISTHGGDIWAKSHYGSGTSMYFTLRKKLEDGNIEIEKDTYNRG